MSIGPGTIQRLANLAKQAQTGQQGQSGLGGGKIDSRQDFGATLEALKTQMEYSMVNDFLQSTMGTESGTGDPLGGMAGIASGSGMNQLQMNMLMTLAEMQKNQQEAPEPIRLSSEEELLPRESEEKDFLQDQAEQHRNQQEDQQQEGRIGELSRQFESGDNGSDSVGYDRMGGTSYGIYQLSSRTGTLNRFLDFLKTQAPELEARLRSAGPANTGGRTGAMPNEWQKIAKEAGSLFDDLQHSFIEDSHYKPAMSVVTKMLGMDESSIPKALREVIFSTAVQHGATGAGNLFSTALKAATGKSGDAMWSTIIDSIYSLRRGRFGGSTKAVQASVASRFEREHQLAMSLLDQTQALS